MKISEAWLREWANPAISTEALVQALTMAGLEVDGVESAAAEFSGVVVGQIESVVPHPDAEKLKVCQVTDGVSRFQVVCGASNASAGIKVPFAKAGAILPNNLAIKKARLRGVESFGMLCGASELGLEDVIDGLMVLAESAPVGDDFRNYLQLDDSVIEIDLTPNRGDCLSVLGVAREIGVLTHTDLTPPPMDPIAAVIEDRVEVVLSASDCCPRYAGRVIKGVDLSAETPVWMRERLRRAGVRSIDAVVDVTNYVMLELGQPMHAFDLGKISAPIEVRRAKPGEKIDLLDSSEVVLEDDYLVIADTERPLAVAGIMGGDYSAVISSTRDILLESAFFEPVAQAGKARCLGMHTDSSHRFERGVDLAGQERAIERATQLLLDITGGKPGPINVVEDKSSLPQSSSVELAYSQIERVLGFAMPQNQVKDIFTRLEFSPTCKEGDWRIKVPSHRFDIAIEADLLEELARIYGYDRLPVEPPLARMTFTLTSEREISVDSLKQVLVGRGYRESINYSFIDPKLQQHFFSDQPVVELANPISADMSVMRTSLLPGLIKAVTYNLSRQQHRLKLFESGLVFLRDSDGKSDLAQQLRLAAVAYGDRVPESWLSRQEAVEAGHSGADSVDFFDLKADVQALLDIAGVANKVVYSALDCAYLHPGQSATIILDGQKIGVMGLLHPKLRNILDIPKDIWLFELDLNLISEKKVPEFKELSKFPEVRRDLAIIVDGNVRVGDVVACAQQNAGAALRDLVLFDRYVGDGIEKGKQSIGLGLIWQLHERTLNDEEVNSLTDNVVAVLTDKFDATLR